MPLRRNFAFDALVPLDVPSCFSVSFFCPLSCLLLFFPVIFFLAALFFFWLLAPPPGSPFISNELQAPFVCAPFEFFVTNHWVSVALEPCVRQQFIALVFFVHLWIMLHLLHGFPNVFTFLKLVYGAEGWLGGEPLAAEIQGSSTRLQQRQKTCENILPTCSLMLDGRQRSALRTWRRMNGD